MSIPPVPDFARLARRPSERLAVVQHVLATDGLQETDYLEWKTGYDLSARPGAAATSKHLIGFANRDLGQAARHADGHAYLLLGLEPGNLLGIDGWDSADVENWLVRFIERELRYDVHYVELSGKQVLFLTIDPPRQGDPIYCMQQASSEPGGNALPGGAVYVRHGGLTDVASAADITRLTARARAAVSTLALRIELDTSQLRVMGNMVLSNDARDAFVEGQRRSLYATLPREQSAYEGFNFSSVAIGERRSREAFRNEVEAYATAVTSHWMAVVAVHQVENEQSTLVPVVVNETDENFEDVVVELTLPFSRTWVYTGRHEARSRLKPPERPDSWGEGLLGSLARTPVGPLGINRPSEPELEEKDKLVTLVRFPPLHVRPHTSHRLQAVLFALPPALAGKNLLPRWRATARNTPGQLENEVGLVVPSLEDASDLGPHERATPGHRR